MRRDVLARAPTDNLIWWVNRVCKHDVKHWYVMRRVVKCILLTLRRTIAVTTKHTHAEEGMHSAVVFQVDEGFPVWILHYEGEVTVGLSDHVPCTEPLRSVGWLRGICPLNCSLYVYNKSKGDDVRERDEREREGDEKEREGYEVLEREIPY